MGFYSFDTSSILNGRRDLFFPTVFKTLWANIENMVEDGQIRSVDVVRDELASATTMPAPGQNSRLTCSPLWRTTFRRRPVESLRNTPNSWASAAAATVLTHS